MRILLTAFEPFGGDDLNPTQQLLEQMPSECAGHTIIKLLLPTAALRAEQILIDAYLQYNPDVVLSLGLAGGSDGVGIERVGINIDDFRIPDNDGNQFINRRIVSDASDGYLVELPVYTMVERIKNLGIPAHVSYSAGTFVCNHILFTALYLSNKYNNHQRAGFIHVPYLPQQTKDTDKPSMELSDMYTALTCVLDALTVEDSVSTSMGSLY